MNDETDKKPMSRKKLAIFLVVAGLLGLVVGSAAAGGNDESQQVAAVMTTVTEPQTHTVTKTVYRTRTKVRTRIVHQVKTVTVEAPTPQPSAPDAGDGCDPNYSGCVPSDQGDVNCTDLSETDIQVTGEDVYGLDRDGDGIACES